MAEIFLNAPIQNGDFDPDSKPGKTIPLIVAQWMRSYYGGNLSDIDLWSNTDHLTLELAQDKLNEKYSSRLISSLGRSGVVRVMSDTDDDFGEWGVSLVEQLIDRKLIESRDDEVFFCGDCHNVICLSDVTMPNFCGSCKSKSIQMGEKTVLMSKIDEFALENTSRATEGNFDKNSYPPHTTIINKKRSVGLSLESVGFAGDVLDPKIGVGLLGIYAATHYDFDEVKLVASRSGISHNLPQLYGFLGKLADELPRLKMQPIAKAPVNYLRYLVDEGVLSEVEYHDVMHNILPEYLVKMHKDMNPMTAERIIFSRL